MKPTILPALRLLCVLTCLTGIAYPLLVTGVSRLCFPRQAAGSLARQHGRVVGSELLAQGSTNVTRFWPRPSAAEFATVPSGASNHGPTSAALRQAIARRAAHWRRSHGLPDDAPVPAGLLLASGSGLDPHLSPEAARFQIARVATARQLDAPGRERLRRLVEAHVEPPQFGFLGEPRVNVLRLNLALDAL